MRSRLFFLNIIGIVLVVGLYFLYQRYTVSSNNSVLPASDVKGSSSLNDTKLVGYYNPSGFSFSYPHNLAYKDTTNEETQYASLTFQAPDKGGSLIVTVADTEAVSVTEWLDDNGIGPDQQVSTYPFGDITATMVKEYDSILAVALDQGAVFVFEATIENNPFYWEGVIETILTTFEFIPPESEDEIQEQLSDEAQESDIIFEGEEIIQ